LGQRSVRPAIGGRRSDMGADLVSVEAAQEKIDE
jgi:hypothetical protein